ncbi:AbrB/MazE/SpoVT family DNA-binding domain-containing protein [Aerococcus sp. HMSC10H05]|uniref:AbrB/MazE/SpoVT family DNA-binding domain-containing protein n=1 Tax=Aerococcus sp. HMSC10H05 TaxID=1581084 RepID=UPI0008A35E66|nr:AbrB/MazE/SpoVT family DNA-binding domain-containing protein [Aerococcus sp. HMSC10H05]OFU50116.1 cell division protein FtsW [Aerococcus sp. HMSC10H05]
MPLTVSKWGNSSAIRLPKQLVEEMDLSINDQLDYHISGNQLIIERRTEVPYLTVDDLFKDYDGEPVNVKPVLFESIGKEQW